MFLKKAFAPVVKINCWSSSRKGKMANVADKAEKTPVKVEASPSAVSTDNSGEGGSEGLEASSPQTLAVFERYCVSMTAQYPTREINRLPDELWRSDVLHDMLSPHFDGLVEAVVTAPRKAILFYGRRSMGEGLTRFRIADCIAALPRLVKWLDVGPELKLRYAEKTVKEGRAAVAAALEEYRRGPGRPRGRASASPSPHHLPKSGRCGRNRRSPSSSPAPERRAPVEERRELKVTNEEKRAVMNLLRRFSATEEMEEPPPRGLEGALPLVSESSATEDTTDGFTTASDMPDQDQDGIEPVRRARRRRRRRRSATPEREPVDDFCPKAKIVIPKFRGDNTSDGVSYLAWKRSVDIHRRTYRDHERLLQHVENSLEGPAANLASSLGDDTTLDSLLRLLDNYYRAPATVCQLQKEMCHMEQHKDEKIAQFAIRLCTIVNKIRKHPQNFITPEGLEDMKKETLFGGLKPSFKASLRYLMDKRTPCTYEKLLVEARELEKQQELTETRRFSQNPAESTEDRAKKTAGKGYAHGALFPQRKLKGHGITSKVQTVEVAEEPAEEGSSAPESEEELEGGESLAAHLSCRIQQASVQPKRTCLLCDSKDHLMRACTWYPKLQDLLQQLNSKGTPSGTARETPKPKDPKSGSNTTVPPKKQ